jgi:tetratricopeptide (TPR) repeat protein
MLRPRSIGLLLALATLLVFLPATSYQFINFDDPGYVTDNPIVQKGLTWGGVKWAFDGVHFSNWHPLTWLSHMLDCDLFRLNPAGPHLVNILFHALNTALLFALMWRLTAKLWPSAFVALLFAWHPLHVESVAWIAERKDVLSTFFTFLALLSYTDYARKRMRSGAADLAAGERSWWFNYIFTLVFFVLALLAKPMPVTLPCVMLLLDAWPLQRARLDQWQFKTLWPLVLEKIPFFMASAAMCLITVFSQNKAISSLTGVPFSFRLENAVTAYVGYLWKMIWPVDLCIFYPLTAPISHALIAESAIILAGISILVWLERKNGPWLLVGWLWFLGTLLPVIGLVQVGGQAMGDRYTYFPLVGIFLAVVFALDALAIRLAFLKQWLVLAAILALGACVLQTSRQLRYWQDSETLFSHALAVVPSAPAHVCLGAAFQDQKRSKEAMTEYLIALQLDPRSHLAYGDVAKHLSDDGKLEQAAVYYQRALSLSPQTAMYHDNLGVIWVKLNRFDEAMREFSAAAQADPTAARPHFLKGRLLMQMGRDSEAVTQLREALKLDPDNVEMLVYTASVLAAAENPEVRNGLEARALARKAVQLTRQQQPATLDVLAMSYAETGKFGEAVLVEQQAIKLAEASGQEDGLELLQKRLKKYEAQQPWRESFKSDTPDPKPEIKK